mgnify:CR=1 FL=1
MPPEPIISVSGLRGIVGESLTDEVARRYATAFAEELPAGPVVIGRDGRASGARFAEVIGAAIAATGGGRKVFDAGPASTPTVGVLVRDLKAAGGVRSFETLMAVREVGVTRVGATATRAILDDAKAKLGL